MKLALVFSLSFWTLLAVLIVGLIGYHLPENIEVLVIIGCLLGILIPIGILIREYYYTNFDKDFYDDDNQ